MNTGTIHTPPHEELTRRWLKINKLVGVTQTLTASKCFVILLASATLDLQKRCDPRYRLYENINLIKVSYFIDSFYA